VTKELDMYRWRDIQCAYCKTKLTTEHIKICPGTEYDRILVKDRSGFEASKVIDDPSLLNILPICLKKRIKSFVAERITKMILSAESRGAA